MSNAIKNSRTAIGDEHDVTANNFQKLAHPAYYHIISYGTQNCNPGLTWSIKKARTCGLLKES